jgi:GNAT superfamily N-acetyltransferase
MATTSADAAARAGEPVLRAYRGSQDHAFMSPVANAVRAHNGSRQMQTVADMTNYYSRFDQAALLRDCALVEVGGAVVAYGRVSFEHMATGDRVVSGILNVHPDHRGVAVEALLLRHAIDRAEELALEHGEPLDLQIVVPDRAPEQRAAAEALGFRRIRQFAQLIRPNLDSIPEIPLPDGFEIRPIAADDRAMHRRVWEASTRGFAGSFGEEVPTERDFERWLNASDFNPPLWRVAFHGDDIAGQILSFMDHEPDEAGVRIGWTEAITTQPEYRRRGIARALLAASLRAVRDAGATKAGLGADLQNPNEAATLYQSMGYEIVSIEHLYALGPFPRAGR